MCREITPRQVLPADPLERSSYAPPGPLDDGPRSVGPDISVTYNGIHLDLRCLGVICQEQSNGANSFVGADHELSLLTEVLLIEHVLVNRVRRSLSSLSNVFESPDCALEWVPVICDELLRTPAALRPGRTPG